MLSSFFLDVPELYLVLEIGKRYMKGKSRIEIYIIHLHECRYSQKIVNDKHYPDIMHDRYTTRTYMYVIAYNQIIISSLTIHERTRVYGQYH